MQSLPLWVSISGASWGPQKILASFEFHLWLKQVDIKWFLVDLSWTCYQGTVPTDSWLCVYDTISLAFLSLPVGKGRCRTNVKIAIIYPANWHLIWARSLARREKGDGQSCTLERLSGHHVGCIHTIHPHTHLNLELFSLQPKETEK